MTVKGCCLMQSGKPHFRYRLISGRRWHDFRLFRIDDCFGANSRQKNASYIPLLFGRSRPEEPMRITDTAKKSQPCRIRR